MDRAEVLEAARIRRALRIAESLKTPRASKSHPLDCRCDRCELIGRTA